jgi:hypothetical protein
MSQSPLESRKIKLSTTISVENFSTPSLSRRFLVLSLPSTYTFLPLLRYFHKTSAPLPYATHL